MDQVHGAVDRRRGHWARRHLAGARALGQDGAHRQGATGRGGHRELDGLLTGAWAAVWRLSDGGEEQWRLELITRAKEGTKGLRREGKRCGEVQGWCSPFIGAGGTSGRGCRGGGGNGGVNVFNAIEDGEVKWRVKEGVLMAG
jgi:hypothetical protein